MDQKKFAQMGGKARAAKLTKEQRSESARHAAAARWAKWRAQNEGENKQ